LKYLLITLAAILGMGLMTWLLYFKKNEALSKNGLPTSYATTAWDMEMNKASFEARRMSPVFVSNFLSKKSGQSDFYVDTIFSNDSGSGEYLWIKVESVDRQKNEYAGSLASEPDNIEKLKIGSPCQGSFANIRDWMFVENGKLVGGYTERVLYSHYSEKEKEIFKRDSKYRIE